MVAAAMDVVADAVLGTGDAAASETSDEQEAAAVKVTVRAYVDRILWGTRELGRTNTSESRGRSMEVEEVEEKANEDSPPPSSVDSYVDAITRALLRACHLPVLTMPCRHLPRRPASLWVDFENFDSHIPPVSPSFLRELVPPGRVVATEPYEYRRVDYLRLLLRSMAPIAMDVAAHAVSILLLTSCPSAASGSKSTTMTTTIDPEDCAAAVILFAAWLPVAPHLTPIVTQFLSHPRCACPLSHAHSLIESSMTCPSWSSSVLWRQVQEMAQALHDLTRFYAESQRDQASLTSFAWKWSLLGNWSRMDVGEVETMTSSSPSSNNHIRWARHAVRWHAVRALGYRLSLASCRKGEYYERFGAEEEMVPWIIHPWEIDLEESSQQLLTWQGKTVLWWETEKTVPCPSPEQIRSIIPLHPYLVEIGSGLVFCRHHALSKSATGTPRTTGRGGGGPSSRLVRTSTTKGNLEAVGAALALLPYPPPILLCGPPGSGKSSLVRELARRISGESSHDCALLEVHVDDETDTKTLIGSYTSSDKWGEFEWRPGALTLAVRQGRWVLIENVDKVPTEIHASLTQLLEDRLLPLGGGKVEMCHPNFRLFGTFSWDESQLQDTSLDETLRRRVLQSDLWHKVTLNPLPACELREISLGHYPSIPSSIVESTLSVFQAIVATVSPTTPEPDAASLSWIGLRASVRDLFKIFSRISWIPFERNAVYTTEEQRTLCLIEATDVLVRSCPDSSVRQRFVQRIAAPFFGLAQDVALQGVNGRLPRLQIHPTCTEIGRVRIPVSLNSRVSRRTTEKFATTEYTLRLMESIGVCVREMEPVLLVGETGCGKTSVLQELARLSGRELVVQNLSLQTDSADLLGGYRPLEMKLVANAVYRDFVDLFSSTFSRKQNAQFLEFALNVLKREQWDKLSQCFRKAAQLGLSKLQERINVNNEHLSSVESWQRFLADAERFEQQRLACDTGMVFSFTEGTLVEAVRQGKWVLLDEINLASSETLQRLCGLLDDSSSSITLTERGDPLAIERHPDFRLFAAMNPATDAGKKELNPDIRSRFTEIFVDEVLDPIELRKIAARYLEGVLPVSDRPCEHTEIIVGLVDLYLECRELAERSLVDGGGQRPRFSLRSLTRALSAARSLCNEQKLPLLKSLVEGIELSFQGSLDLPSSKLLSQAIASKLMTDMTDHDSDHPARRPGGRGTGDSFVLIKPFWIKSGPLERVDWSKNSEDAHLRFVLTETTRMNLRRLVRAVVSGPWPIILEGPTSAGKTTLVQYLAALCGHTVIRINNHEHTDVQEYTGGYASDASGSLVFQDGLLVQALRRGHWVILDELNLAPSDVLEALNRLLDDNRELYLPETHEVVRPHPSFRLFATQNPAGAYGGRKQLSRAFRNRFVELHIGDLPAKESIKIVEERCSCPPSHAAMLVDIMEALRRRRSRSGLFLGKDGIMTPRDLLRWAHRGTGSKQALAREGYMLLAERLRTQEEKEVVEEEIETRLKVDIGVSKLYDEVEPFLQSNVACDATDQSDHSLFMKIAPTRSFLRLVTLVSRCIEQKEPMLLVGDTGNGKTTVVQLLSYINKTRLHVVNCHATTETSDLLGCLRPLRGRSAIAESISAKAREFLRLYRQWMPNPEFNCTSWNDGTNLSMQTDESDSDDSPSHVVTLITSLWREWCSSDLVQRGSKRVRRDPVTVDSPENANALLGKLFEDVCSLGKRYNALFEWVDGPLVEAMKNGDYILLDEMSLADDAVLERLNSLLEPSRSIVLAEMGSALDSESSTIEAKDGFQLFATMNPGGDFGKRELSPALRNRFTEIWVPPVTDSIDVDLVLERTLAGQTPVHIKVKIMEYFDWFNNDVCCDPRNPNFEMCLSLRDVLTWAEFIVAASKSCPSIDIWDLYRQGAYLMHLDGIGLGTGMGRDRANKLKSMAESFLTQQLTDCMQFANSERSNSNLFRIEHGKFGRSPFWIEMGSRAANDPLFDFEAPTTSTNLIRVLRAMQLRKPILLEGCPGAGKTGLVEALAVAAGHRLVRINLSEQSDISDLFGSDLPLSEDNSRSRGAFQWCDGVLLSAIKSGDWVLLDELNLAPQSVLEGLNSCLDHRSAVYIPEIGQSFICPKSFRVFAAQNPVAQGGGRKGLPKSFLNRFTKVYVDPLTSHDFSCIIHKAFPGLDKSMVTSMIRFNEKIHIDSVERMEIGRTGGPWEFNLRDIFRWCDLCVRNDSPSSSCPVFARDLYTQRFRSVDDRVAVAATFESLFEGQALSLRTPRISSTQTVFRVGTVTLPKNIGSSRPLYEFTTSETDPLMSLLEPLEAVVRCASMRWPCLLVGDSRDAISSIVNVAAESTGVKVLDVCLSPSSDVSELIGCFEQVDTSEEYRAALRDLANIAVEYAIHPDAKEIDRVLDFVVRLSHSDQPDRNAIVCAQDLTSILAESGNKVGDESFIERMGVTIEKVREISSTTPDILGRNNLFIWKDGPLVEAMSSGFWIHFHNVNLCPATVLDRLNPVLEPGGSLVLSECGTNITNEKGKAHRELVPHPNFTAFLSMDPMNGEISRAMRNRCVEVSLIDSVEPERGAIDCSNAAWRSKLFLPLTGTTWIGNSEFRSITRSKLLGRFISSLTRRGNGRKWVRRLLREDIDIAAAFSAAGQQQVTVSRIETKSCPPLRGGWVVAPLFSQISWEARILRQSGSDFDFSAFALDNNEDTMVLSRNVLLNRFLVRHTREDLIWRALYLSRIASGTGAALQFLAERCARLCALASTSGSSVIQTVNFGVADPRYLLWFLLTRGPQALTEASWLRSHMSEQDRDSVSVLRASQLIASGGLIMAPDTCPVTPSLMPLFLSLDEMCGALIDVVLKSNSGGAIVESLIGVLSTRDELWNLLNTIKFTPHTSRYLHFEDDTEFNVLWTEFRKVLSAAEVTFLRFLDPYKHLFCQRINDLVESIDSAVFGPNGNKAAEHLNVMQGFPLPLVPKTSSDWSLVLDTYSFDNCFAICGGLQSANERTDTIDLERLINICHPILFVTRKTKRDIIDANIMGRLASLGNELGPLAEALPKLDPDVAKAIGSDILCLKASFVSQMRHFKVGVGLNRLNSAAALGDVQTDDDFFQATNEQEPEVLDSGLDFERISESLLDRFARIQLSPIAQCYCERMERMNIELLYGWLLGVISMDSLQRDLSVPSLSSLLDFMIVEAQWTPSEVVCHETLLWLAEASLLTNRQITRRLLPMMTTYASRHTLKGSSFLCRYISPKLELPKAGGETIEVNKMRERNSRVGFSNCRTTQGNVPDVVVFSLIGREFWPHRSRELVAGAAFLTIENCVVRDRQCRTLTGLLAALDCSFQSQMIHELTYKLFETLLALGASSLSGEKCLLDSLTTGPPEPPEIIMSEIGHLVDVFKLPITAIVIIWRCLHSAWRIRADAGIEVTQKSDLGSKEIAIAGAFIGLIRFHVFLPVSAVDPGRRPQGVVSLLNRRLVRLSIEDAACRLETSLIDAGMKKDTHEALARRSEISRIVTSRAKQEAEIIRRPAKCPAFVDLYQELHDFASDIMPIDAMAEFIQLLTTCSETASKHGHDALVQRESHFQVTAEGFCDRLLHHFGAYEDVVAPLVDAVEGMRVGLATISRAVAGEGSAQTTLHNLTNFCSGVPLGEEDGIRNLLKYAASASDFTHDRTLERDAALAVLSRLVVTRAVHGMDQKLLVLWDDVISRVMPKQDAGFSYCSPDATTEKDMTDVEYQQLFPNYRRAFEALCIKSDDDVTVPDSTNDDSVTTRTPHDFEDEELELLQRIHSDFFADSTHIDNSMWLRAFRLSYGVAARLFEVEERETASIYVHGYARHALAISMCSTAYFNDTAQCPCASPDRDFSDFHRDPSPSEVSKAKLPLDKLQARVNQLLSCFPENSVLDVIAKVTDRVKKLNLLSCSVSRAMGGLEVVLKNAQDWEQHASKRFQIGEPLILLSNLISRWRKLELQSWAHLLRAREVRCEKRSQKYWFKLHSVLIASASEPQAGDTVLMCEENAHLFVPKWVWKGCAAQGHRLASPHNLASADLTDVLEAVDTFVLTATLAEFEVRLEMIRAFARQLSYEYRLRGSTSRTVLLAHALRWLAFYYEQFSSQVADCIAECRKPFEKKLEEQSKLAKWDEQSYYSLAESSERNHRALMTVLRGYDEKLDKNVGIVLDEVLCSGVRRPAEEADTASTLFPQHDVMFSCVTADEVFEQRSDGNVHDTGLNRRAWVDPALLGAGERSYCSRIAQLARKISEVQDQSRCKQSFASNGRTQVSTMSSAIFERLDSLRSGKATRPMKERALVDLVKELKRQGFAPGKWQVPAEIKSMGSIWQLPCWNLSKLNTLGQELELSLVTCDKYIQRCLAEAPRLRHEVSVIGSRHLPLRQIEMLLNLSESGLLLTIQQRCSLFLVLNERQRLESLVKILDLLCNSSIPGGQSELISRFMLWMKDTRLAAESVKELRIFLANMVDQVEDPDKSKSTRVLLHHLDAYVQDAQIPEMTEALLLAEHDVKDARRSHEALDAMTSRLKTFRNDLVGVLPLEPIVGCVCACEKSLESGFSFLDFRPDFAACDSISLQAYLQAVSNAVEATLMSVQVWTSSALTNDADVDEVATIWDSHRKLMQTWGSINVRKIATLVTEVVAKLKCVHDDQSESEIRDNATWLTTDLLVLVKTSLESTDQLLRESIDFHRETSKLQYVLLRVFRILVSKGFCASPNEDESHDSGNDPAGGTTFEESQGVGMGEGDGIQDVTEQLESEEQLLGLKGEKDENERSSDNPRQLGDEEAKQGMEMEENFDGDMFDVPRDHENDSETHAGDDDKEEVEREMGEGGLNDEVLDERMWNEDDDEGSSPSEKLEDGSNVPGAPESDEITTKDDTAEKNLDNESEILFIQKEKGSFQPEESVEDVIKDDASENHEENHESQVSSDDPNRERTVDAGVLELDEQLSLGDDGSASKDEEEASFEEDLGEAAEENSVSAQPESGDESSRTESGQDNAENDANFDVTITDPQLGNESEPLKDDKHNDHCLSNHQKPQTGLGVSAIDGKDAVGSQDLEELGDQADGKDNMAVETAGAQSDLNDGHESREGVSEGSDSQGRTPQQGEGDTSGAQAEPNKVPNPLMHPADAALYWHRKLNVIRTDEAEVADAINTNESPNDPKPDGKGDFEHTKVDGPETTLMLGEVDEEDATPVRDGVSQDGSHDDERVSEQSHETERDQTHNVDEKLDLNKKSPSSKQHQRINIGNGLTDKLVEEQDDVESVDIDPDGEHLDEDTEGDKRERIVNDTGNQVVSDISQLQGTQDGESIHHRRTAIVEDDVIADLARGGDIQAVHRTKDLWSMIHSETHHLARRLCEKLRLVMEPLVASKLRGDYRTGKRINMKRVIGYIASGYRRDKIWLRRTKPAKRNYRVLVAVDDSESMRKSGAGEMALRAMATLAIGMSQLDIGQIGLASFGDEMRVLHPFDRPFTPERGPEMVRQFSFAQPRTRTALCVESTLRLLDTPGDHASMQLVFMISDGRIERDSRTHLRRLLREMHEKNILLALVIVEGEAKKDSILTMREVAFQKGKPVVKRFIDDYPFPYYIILNDMQSLPEVLGDALRQWFEMLARLHGR